MDKYQRLRELRNARLELTQELVEEGVALTEDIAREINIDPTAYVRGDVFSHMGAVQIALAIYKKHGSP